mmetsp:Transcript_2286/g.3804  ORF Transcript_2286/g.3804 Transcript_2286/m.3804 type:complete len:84 (+) Transcript_2286:201-452(+)
MSTFCEVRARACSPPPAHSPKQSHSTSPLTQACDSHYLPNRGHVDWFKTEMNIEGSDIYSACRECRMILERSGIELPNVFHTA